MSRRAMGLWGVVIAGGMVGFFLLVLRPEAPPENGQASPGKNSKPAASVPAETPGPTATPATGSGPDPARSAPAAVSASGVRILPSAGELVEGLNASSEAPERDVAILEAAFASYRRIFGKNPPGGLNAEISAALLGRNPRGLAVIPPDLSAVNAGGEILDRWGTPFYFHPVSDQVMEVLSAGPDRALWTADDVGSLHPAGRVPVGE